MKKIDVPWLGLGQQIWFNIGRIKRVEGLLKKPISEVASEMTGLNITNLIVLLQVGNIHNGMKSEQYYEDIIQEALDSGVSIREIYSDALKAVIGSGVLGDEMYYQIFPEEMIEETQKNLQGATMPE